MNPLKVIKALEDVNIESRPLWKPMHLQPLFQNTIAVVDGASEALFRKGICLPSGSCISDEDVKRVCHTVLEILS
jgi:UDP-N-acetylbacillosamine transaminase